jgi:hypothetical protein
MQRTLRHKRLFTVMSCLALMIPSSAASAQLIAVPASAFPVSATLLSFNGLADGVDVNGLVLGGITFSYSLGNGNVIIDGGPGITNNVDPQNAVSIGNPSGILTLILPGFYDMFGYGYALLTVGTVPNATSITAFSGATNLGSVSFTASADPAFSGGFAGVQSTTPFDRVQFVFNNTAPAFAFDNVRLNAASNLATIPEPSTTLLIGAGLVAMVGVARKRRQAP